MKNWPRNIKPITLAAWLVLSVWPQVRAENVSATAIHIDGHSIVGHLHSLTNNQVQLSNDKHIETLSFEDLMSLTFNSPLSEKNSDVTIFLADGGRLYAELVDSAEDAIVVRAQWGETLTLPFDSLAGVKLAKTDDFAESAQLFADALEKPLPGQDVLITRSKDKPRVMRGRLISLQVQDGRFVYSDRERSFKREKIFGIIFAGLRQDSNNNELRIDLIDGSIVFAQVNRLDKQQLVLDTRLAGQITLPIEYIKKIKLFSRRIAYLSDLSPLAETIEGRIHRPWPLRRDRSVAMHPIRLGGEKYDKGLGVHSRTRISFDVSRSYDRFVSTIGLDDSVAPRGSVVFQVLGDDKMLFDSEIMHGSDQPRLVSVEISNVNVLTLLVDYGDEIDLADHADWAGARLIKKPSRLENSTNTQ